MTFLTEPALPSGSKLLLHHLSHQPTYEDSLCGNRRYRPGAVHGNNLAADVRLVGVRCVPTTEMWTNWGNGSQVSGKFLPHQKPGIFHLDRVMQKLSEGGGSK